MALVLIVLSILINFRSKESVKDKLYMGWSIAQALTTPFVKRKQGGHLNGAANVRNNSKY